ncbi:hypothetical protein CspeluHIS016_0211300 [Cutaneotrichosporon spelunceum]|uniref:Cytochrome b5 heme-binding domain-containing protein n=1 Tax=Cutaneotrichosporon spelunceum TaxID=1672016 RepID=A0AAD3TSY3_9TREE|nr:hypothetical protein CspeluHIS016_0211300 [Cutaneotrichosporon spelunceum]
MPPNPTRIVTRDEVAQHNTEGDLWVIIDTFVYDLSKFAQFHPGGLSVLLDDDVAGRDATTTFFSLHGMEVLVKPQHERLIIARLDEEPRIRRPAPGDLSRVPYGENNWLSPAFQSPYYSASHHALRKALREFVDTKIYPEAQAHEISGKEASVQVKRDMAESQLNHMRLGPGKHLHGRTLMGGVRGEDFDYFHELVVVQELSRIRAKGYSTGAMASIAIGLPPVMNFGKEPVRSRVLREVLEGEKMVCLCITEAFAGSDVSGIRSRAVRQPDGSWVLNGTKKWITGGMYADYFSVAAKTYGGSCPDGAISMFLVPRGEGVQTKFIPTMYSPSAGTAYVTFDKVRVAPDHLLGEEGRGLFIVLSNFNKERWGLIAGAAATCRLVTHDCILWAAQRDVFGKPLLAQPVIRLKLAAMIGKTEAAQNWLENMTFQMNHMDYAGQARHLAGQLAFLKMMVTRWMNEVIDDAVQIFGGRALTKTGTGRFVERAHASKKFEAVGGGSEEIMGDLGMRQLMRDMPKDQKL